MQFRVTHMAFHEGGRVRPGDVLDVPETFKANWGVPVVKGAADTTAASKTPRKRETIALSQVAREKAAGPLDDLV